MESETVGPGPDEARRALDEVRSTRVDTKLSRLTPLWFWFGCFGVMGLQTAALALSEPYRGMVSPVLLCVWLGPAMLLQRRTGIRLGLAADNRPLLRWMVPGLVASGLLCAAGYELARHGSVAGPVVLGLLSIPIGTLCAWRGDLARRARLRAAL
jgi:hypothetical protein